MDQLSERLYLQNIHQACRSNLVINKRISVASITALEWDQFRLSEDKYRLQSSGTHVARRLQYLGAVVQHDMDSDVDLLLAPGPDKTGYYNYRLERSCALRGIPVWYPEQLQSFFGGGSPLPVEFALVDNNTVLARSAVIALPDSYGNF